MKTFKNIIIVLLIFVFPFMKSYSQEGVSFHVGPAFPLSDFASDDEDNEEAGNAAVGINVGFQYVTPLTESGLGLFGGIDFVYNSVTKEYKKNVKTPYELGGIDAEYKFESYLNIPITAGLNATFQVHDNFDFFTHAGVAINFLKKTNQEIKMGNSMNTKEVDVAINPGVKLGAGISVKNKVIISLDYLGLGTHELSVKGTSFLGQYETDDKQKVDLFTLTLGVYF